MDEESQNNVLSRAKKDSGVTFDLKNNCIVERLDEWCFPRWPECTVAVPENRLEAALSVFLHTNKDKLAESVYLGIWKNEQKYYIDLNAHVKSFHHAEKLAKRYSEDGGRSIMSAYNPARDEVRYFSSGL